MSASGNPEQLALSIMSPLYPEQPT